MPKSSIDISGLKNQNISDLQTIYLWEYTPSIHNACEYKEIDPSAIKALIAKKRNSIQVKALSLTFYNLPNVMNSLGLSEINRIDGATPDRLSSIIIAVEDNEESGITIFRQLICKNITTKPEINFSDN